MPCWHAGSFAQQAAVRCCCLSLLVCVVCGGRFGLRPSWLKPTRSPQAGAWVGFSALLWRWVVGLWAGCLCAWLRLAGGGWLVGSRWLAVPLAVLSWAGGLLFRRALLGWPVGLVGCWLFWLSLGSAGSLSVFRSVARWCWALLVGEVAVVVCSRLPGWSPAAAGRHAASDPDQEDGRTRVGEEERGECCCGLVGSLVVLVPVLLVVDVGVPSLVAAPSSSPAGPGKASWLLNCGCGVELGFRRGLLVACCWVLRSLASVGRCCLAAALACCRRACLLPFFGRCDCGAWLCACVCVCLAA